MHYDLHVRAGMRERLGKLAGQMRAWEEAPRIDGEDRQRLLAAIQFFNHTTTADPFRIAGIDGSGDFPSLAYGDSFVYSTVAHSTVYETVTGTGLREVATPVAPVIEFTWIPEEAERRRQAWDEAFAILGGRDIPSVIEQSDYRVLKAATSGRQTSSAQLLELLIRPHASDSANVAIQLRSTGELGAAARLLEANLGIRYLLTDGTLSLPLITRRDVSLFYEHLKRLCCVLATRHGVGLLAISKSHGLPAMEVVEELAREKAELPTRQVAEHWYLRLPFRGIDTWVFALAEGRQLPPVGAMTYLFRLHRNVPVFRFDLDLEYWRTHIRGSSEAQTLANEQRLLGDLDYASHDQRCFGYPYPIKAGHDRASLTQAERVALRKQIVEAAVAAGLRRSMFRDASAATGHE